MDNTNSQKPQRWWQYSVSTMLLLTALVAGTVGWWLDRQKLLDQQRRESAEQLRKTEREIFMLGIQMRLLPDTLKLEESRIEMEAKRPEMERTLQDNEKKLDELTIPLMELRAARSTSDKSGKNTAAE